MKRGDPNHYLRLAIELAIDFVIMYLVMYTMIRSLDHFYLNINNVWMTLMMVTPMALVMMVAMRSMFPSRNRNLLVVAGALVVFGVSYYGMRTQWAVGDEQFLKSMIPHHSGAILMCQEASITDPEIEALCREIVAAQRREIAQMEAMLERY
ncbi:hypothetical protein N799_13045 [Lysobacter arseniciresistens ZS79]|uniref:DUF305 domain-containing protein n=2 Tax=Novilysobacter TaxID=3382699 RepID=A0A0A0F0V9_9GAMM|nr:hypothetical protein N799_13045 [Lysobacter arseniciresistens ZS79]